MPLSFGVITPVKLPAPHLEEMIESVKKNAKGIDVTHYIIVDSSPADELVLPPGSITSGHSYNMLIAENHHKAGPSGARNTALDLCKDDVVAFIDADDVWEENYLEKLVALYTSDPFIAMVSVPGYKFGAIATDGQLVQPWLTEGGIAPEFFAWNPIGCPTGFSYRATDIQSPVRFPEGMWYCEDYAFYLLLFSQTQNKCYRYNESYYRYRVSAAQSLSNVLSARLESSREIIPTVLSALEGTRLSASIPQVERHLLARLSRMEGVVSLHYFLILICSPGWLRAQFARWKRNLRLAFNNAFIDAGR